MQEDDRSFIGLTLSILIHVAVILLLIFMPKLPEPERREVTEITIIDNSKKAQAFVTDTDVPKKDLIEDMKEKAKYLSKETKRVKEEVKARNNGRTQNSDLNSVPNPTLEAPSSQGAKKTAGQGKGGEKTKNQQQKPKDQEIHSSMAGLQPKPKQVSGMGGPGEEGMGRNIVMGGSALAEYIPGVKEGGFTALNTDQFTYYTFFARINEQVRYRWVSLVRSYIGGLSETALNQLSQYQRVYQIEIVLSDTGQYMKGFIHHSSGEQALDMTAIDAFQAAAPFLNPPKGLVEDDGYIHLHYSFLIEFRPRNGLGSN